MANFCHWAHKVSRTSIVVATPSILNLLYLNKLFFTVKPIITHVLLNFIMILFLGDRNKYHVTMTSQ